jgi:integrase
MSPEKALLASNTRLKLGGISIRIEIKNNHLVLRGILPPKPGSDRPTDYEQKIYLSYPALPEGVKQAESDALAIKVALIEKRFDWYNWSKKIKTDRDNPVDMTIAAVTARFEIDYFTRRAKNPKSETTWRIDYAMCYKKLPQDKLLSEAVIMAAIATTTPETRTRRRYVQSLAALAKFAGLDIDISAYGKGYSPAKVELRLLPTDAEIELYHSLIPNKSWQNAYALIATFGLRPHEIMHLDLSELPVLDVLDSTKTKFHRVRALHTHWIEKFDIRPDMVLPAITFRRNEEIGSRVGHQFTRYGIPFPAYNLRHAYAIRCSITYQMPVAIAAKMMGHSAAIHQNVYLRHVTDESIDEIFDKKVKEKELG